ncbi:hypothetical protein HK098_001241 [Nowakowskiella sp. JEL0407]|nr:hypothetical protein HK098_001241 [Nowakowskiella sp. JEL0407]
MQKIFSSRESDRNSYITNPTSSLNTDNLHETFINLTPIEKSRSSSRATDRRKGLLDSSASITIEDASRNRKKPRFIEILKSNRALVAFIRYMIAISENFTTKSTPSNTPSSTTSKLPIGSSIRTLRGHTDGITQMIAVPGSPPKLYTCSFDKTFREWDTSTGLSTRIYLDPNNTAVIGLAYYPPTEQNPALLFSGSTEPLIHEWSLANTTLLRNFAGHTGSIQYISISESIPPRLVSASTNGEFIQWDFATGTPAPKFNIPGTAYSNGFVILSGTFPRLYSADSDFVVREWDLSTGRLLRTYSGHTGPVMQVAILPGSTPRLFSCSVDTTVIEWDTTTGRATRTFTGHTAKVSSVIVIPGTPARLFSASFDKSVIEWDLNTGKVLRTFLGHSDQVTALAYLLGTPPRLFSGSADRTVLEWVI